MTTDDLDPAGQPVTASRLRTGRAAEDLVAARLAAAGWTVLARNARSRHGELDVVALDGTTLVFVEVKAGRAGAATGPERPILAIGPRKQLKVRRLAAAWMAANRNLPRYDRIRFDAAGVTYDRSGTVVDFEYLKNAF